VGKGDGDDRGGGEEAKKAKRIESGAGESA
jgi:hypothetical protein